MSKSLTYVFALWWRGIYIWRIYGALELWKRGIFFVQKKKWERKMKKENMELYSSVFHYHGTTDRLRILFVSSGIDRNGFSERYRVRNFVEALQLRHIEAEIIYETDIREGMLSKIAEFPIVVFFRIPASIIIERFIELLKKNNTIIIFSIDDLLFGPEIIPYLDISANWSKEDKRMFGKIFLGYRKTLELSHYCIASSHLIAETAEAIGKKSYVIPSALSTEQIETARQVLLAKPDKPSSNGGVILGYVSGSATHNADFASITEPICKILENYPDVKLYFVGPISIPAILKKFKSRIKKYPFTRNLKRLMELMRTIDINLAPLEAANPFCRAKNDMKYFEAGILGIPTVATKIEAFSNTIRSGYNGFLAENNADWFECLKVLIKSSAKRKRMGDSALSHVQKFYVPSAQAPLIERTFREIIKAYIIDNEQKTV